jgi:hypothetical protein
MTGILAACTIPPYYAVNLNDSTFHAYSSTSVTASCTYATAGTFTGSSNGSTASNTSGAWLTAGSASGLEIKADIVSGSVTSGTTGSWLSLASDRTWTKTQTPDGTSAVSLTISIRNAATLEVLDSATVTIRAENE